MNRLQLAHAIKDAPALAEAWADKTIKADERKPKVKPARSARGEARSKRARKATKRETRASVRAAVVLRAEGRCEAPIIAADQPLIRCTGYAAEWDHFWGRGRDETADGSWMLCTRCHREKTLNHPDRRAWLVKFSVHADYRHLHSQIPKIRRALDLERAQHPEARRRD